MKQNKKASALPRPAESIRKVYEVYSGHAMIFDGAIVVEGTGGAERILYYFQSKGAVSPYDSDAECEADRIKMVAEAEAVAADPKNFRRYRSDIIDYRRYGAPDSKERMPDEPYEWHGYLPGRFGKDHCRRFFPYCPHRFNEMNLRRAMLLMNAGGSMLVGEMTADGKLHPYPWYAAAHEQLQTGKGDGAK
jgi:hypothetical protein